MRSAVQGRGVVATSQPLAAEVARDALGRGGSAVDAAIAAAAALVVVEPTGCGLGSDLFAMVATPRGEVVGLASAGRSPAGWTPSGVPEVGAESVTVPGAVAGWAALHARFSRLPFASLLAPAAKIAREGFTPTPGIAASWRTGLARHRAREFQAHFALEGARWSSEALARSLEELAETGGRALYVGALGERVARYLRREGSAMTSADLAAHRVRWEVPLEVGFRGRRILEMPPPGQGLAALTALGTVEALASLAGEEARLSLDDARGAHLAVEAMKLGILDVERHVADPAAMKIEPEALLHPRVLQQNAESIDPDVAYPIRSRAPRGGTVLVVTGDEAGGMCALIQSNYMGFGSGLVVPETGVSLQNRGAGFVDTPGHPNEVGPSKQPLHTILPAMVVDDDGPRAAFGVMGGAMQPQGHLQLMLRWLDEGLDPQAAIERPRFRVMDDGAVALEPGSPRAVVDGLRARGHEVRVDDQVFYGGAQMIARGEGGFVAGSDPRRDGLALALR